VISFEVPGSISSCYGKISHYPISKESSPFPFFLPFAAFFFFLSYFFFGFCFGFDLGFAFFFPFLPLTTPPYFSWGSLVNSDHCSSRISLASAFSSFLIYSSNQSNILYLKRNFPWL
jgi:energy-coupling factor transporter transmembrane protein EcfT